MKITTFQINNEGTIITLILTDAENADTLLLWKGTDYKDYDKAINLSSKLNQSASQTIEITLDDINESQFDGIYYIEVEDDTSTEQALTGYLVRYKECILDKVSELSLCDDCLKKQSTSLINAQSLLSGLEYAIEQGFIEEAINIRKALDKYCSNECKTCGKYNNILNNNYYGYNSD